MKISRYILSRLFYLPKFPAVTWPNNKKFAFTIIDDTDQATLDSIRPIYDLFIKSNLLITKTIWVYPTKDTEDIDNSGDTISDDAYCNFIKNLKNKHFEISFHCARGSSSKRNVTEKALRKFNNLFNEYPKIHINHSQNRENLYSGKDKLSFPLLKIFYNIIYKNRFEGHLENSEYFWGDLAQKHITYVRDFHFDEIDLFKIYPTIPYHDKRRPYVNYWFHASDGSNLESFCKLLHSNNINHLEENGGLCIVYTHLGKGFCKDGNINSDFIDCIEDISSRNGWFAPVSEILDYVQTQRGYHKMSFKNRVYMELVWTIEKLFKGTT